MSQVFSVYNPVLMKVIRDLIEKKMLPEHVVIELEDFPPSAPRMNSDGADALAAVVVTPQVEIVINQFAMSREMEN